VGIILKDSKGQRAPNLMQFHPHCFGGAVSGVCNHRYLGFFLVRVSTIKDINHQGSETVFAPLRSFIWQLRFTQHNSHD